ncbi:dienelactone hydrolase family protein [Corynebacterium sp. 335C]
MANLNKLVSNLSKRGPHRVLVGDLSFAGLPGKVYVPAEGKKLPAVAFGHDWREPIENYHHTLRHLASWGIAVAAPDTENGFVADHRGLAADLESCLQILAGVRLGSGEITVLPSRMGLVGHGMGAGAAVLAAADREPLKGVAAIYPAEVAPPAAAAATNVEAPGLILAPGENQWLDRGNPKRLTVNWKGDVMYREVQKAEQGGFSESPMWRRLLGSGKNQRKERETALAYVTGFLLATVGEDKDYAAFADPNSAIKGTKAFGLQRLRDELPETEYVIVKGHQRREGDEGKEE